MKILQINSVISYGSTGRLCRDIADILEANGHDSVIAYGRGEDVKGYKTIKIGSKLDNLKHYAKSFFFNRHGLGSRNETKSLIRKIEEYDPDIIQLHNIHGYYLHIGELFKYLKQVNKPVVWLLHDQWVFSGGAAYFNLEANEILPKLESILERKQEYPKSLLRINQQKNYKEKEIIFSHLENCVIITPSKWLKEIASKSFLNQYPRINIYNGIDVDSFKPRDNNLRIKYNIHNKKILIAVASVWDSRKGIDFIKTLPDRLPSDTQIVMIGVKESLKKKMPNSIITISQTESVKELAEWYSAADVLINPTLFDNFPTVNIEALACGTPVITYDTGGSGEAIAENTGKVIKQNNQEEFIKAINECRRKTQDIVNACMIRSKLFDKDKQYKKYIEIYESLL